MSASFACDDCPKRFPSPRALSSHRRVHGPSTACYVCKKQVRYLIPHLKTHNDALEVLVGIIVDLDDRLARLGA